MDYFSSIQSLLTLNDDILYILNDNDNKHLIYRFLNIRNVLNEPNHIKCKKLSKLYKFGQDQNVSYIEKDYDFEQNVKFKLVLFDDITQQIDDYNDNLLQIDIYLFVLHQILIKAVNVNDDFHAIYTKIYTKINELSQSNNKSQS